MIPPIMPIQKIFRDRAKKELSQDIMSRRLDGLIPSIDGVGFGCHLYFLDENDEVKRQKVDIFA